MTKKTATIFLRFVCNIILKNRISGYFNENYMILLYNYIWLMKNLFNKFLKYFPQNLYIVLYLKETLKMD